MPQEQPALIFLCRASREISERRPSECREQYEN